MNTSQKITPLFLVTLFLILTACMTQVEAQDHHIRGVDDPDSYKKYIVPLHISTLKNDFTYPASIDLHMNQKLAFDITLPSEETYYYDDKFCFSTSYNADGTDKDDDPILIQGGETLGYFWYPQRTGTVVLTYEVKWHDRKKSTNGVPIIIDKNGPPQVETIKVTVDVKEVGK
ncbi:MAG: hypothetical protein ACOYK6_00515 [Chthoniobacterales bacterium]